MSGLLPSNLSILIIEFPPPFLRITFHISSSLVHFDIEFVLLALGNIEELLLTIKDQPKESFALCTRDVLHGWIITLASVLGIFYLAIGIASSASCYSLTRSWIFCFQVCPSVIGGRVFISYLGSGYILYYLVASASLFLVL